MSALDAVEAKNLSSVRRLCLEVFSQGRLDVLEEAVSAGYLNHNAAPGVPPGREGLAAVVQMVRTAMPDFGYRIEEELAMGDRVAVRLSASGTHTGPLLGHPADREERVLERGPLLPLRGRRRRRALGRQGRPRDAAAARRDSPARRLAGAACRRRRPDGARCLTQCTEQDLTPL